MRIYENPLAAVREVEREIYEMGLNVHPQTMQDKFVGDNPDYQTKELQSYGFQISGWKWEPRVEEHVVNYVLKKPNEPIAPQLNDVLAYIDAEFHDRVGGVPLNPGNSYKYRLNIWNEFLHDGKFAYTYSERMAPQVHAILKELIERPETRQAIINIHSNICPYPGEALEEGDQGDHRDVWFSRDLENIGGGGRIPCSMYYQILRRNSAVDFIYTMRSCDFLVHFPVDLMLALRLQSWFATQLHSVPGRFTYFTGSLHSYAKDLRPRGIF